MGNSTSRVVGCFVRNGKDGVDLDFLEPLDEGLGHSFCYVRPVIDSPAITPSNSERFTVDSSTLDSETHSGSFRQEIVDDLILQRPNKNVSETTFKTISGASVSANASTARTVAVYDQHVDTQERAASFESTASFAALPLQPVPRGLTLHSGSLSGPLNGFLSGPLERGFASGPLERGSGFMSGPIEKGAFMSGPLDSADKINFSAPLSYSRRRANFGRLMRSMSRPMRNALSRTFSRHPSGPGLMQRVFMRPVAQFMSNYPKDAKFRQEVPRNCLDSSLTSSGIGPSECEYDSRRNLQWAHGKAGEDRVHVVLSEEHGWLFVGIYDGFSGPDAPDFLMSNLYKAIDKELEGLLWDYETNPPESGLSASAVENVGTSSDCRKEAQPVSQTFAGALLNGVEASQAAGNVVVGSDLDKNGAQSNVAHVGDASVTQQASDGVLAESSGEVWQDEIVQEKDDTDRTKLSVASETGQIWWVFPRNSSPNLMGHGRKSKRLYELLQLDDDDVQAVLEVGTSRRASWDSQQSLEDLHCRGKLPLAHSLSRFASSKECGSSCLEEVANSREGGAAVREEPKHGVGSSFSVLEHKQITTGSLIGSKLRKMYKRQRSLRKKLFPWSYDWHRGQTHVIERVVDTLAPIRRCKLGPIDHTAVLKAMSRSLEITEDAYMEMVESVLDKNPELALMGSCVLVMLMKDQDVYVMNIGDSRALLAQERLNDRQSNPNLVKDDVRHRNKSRESFVRVELDRISEESPVHNQNNQVSRINRNREISICRLKMRAFQLSTDHSTSVEEEVLRIKAEHIDDDQAIFKDRVKGQLKVTRAFGAGFLKKPKCNDALLEMFRIDYIGTAPYISCAPSVAHHHLSSNDRFLVLSSDGLYQYFSNDEVVSHVQWFMENVPEGDPAQYLIAELLFRAAKKNGMDFHELLDIPHGDRRKYHDDVSVMVVSLEGRIWRSSG